MKALDLMCAVHNVRSGSNWRKGHSVRNDTYAHKGQNVRSQPIVRKHHQFLEWLSLTKTILHPGKFVECAICKFFTLKVARGSWYSTPYLSIFIILYISIQFDNITLISYAEAPPRKLFCQTTHKFCHNVATCELRHHTKLMKQTILVNFCFILYLDVICVSGGHLKRCVMSY